MAEFFFLVKPDCESIWKAVMSYFHLCYGDRKRKSMGAHCLDNYNFDWDVVQKPNCDRAITRLCKLPSGTTIGSNTDFCLIISFELSHAER